MERNEVGWAFKAGYLKASANLVNLLQSEDLHPASVCTFGLLGTVTKVMHKFLYKASYCEHKLSNMCSNISIKIFHITSCPYFLQYFIVLCVSTKPNYPPFPKNICNFYFLCYFFHLKCFFFPFILSKLCLTSLRSNLNAVSVTESS